MLVHFLLPWDLTLGKTFTALAISGYNHSSGHILAFLKNVIPLETVFDRGFREHGATNIKVMSLITRECMN